jgi:hypothetical protein
VGEVRANAISNDIKKSMGAYSSELHPNIAGIEYLKSREKVQINLANPLVLLASPANTMPLLFSLPRIEECRKRIRGYMGGACIIDTNKAKLV